MLHRPAPAQRGRWDAQLKHSKELPKLCPGCRWLELTQLGPGRHRHRHVPSMRGLFCPGESCCPLPGTEQHRGCTQLQRRLHANPVPGHVVESEEAVVTALVWPAAS